MAEPYYSDEWTTLYHGEAVDVLRGLPSASVDVLLTDPPYSSGGAFRGDRINAPDAKYRGWSQNSDGTSRAPTAEYGTFGGDNRDQRAYSMWLSLWTSQCLRITRPGGQAFLFTDWRQLPTTTDAVQLGGWTWRGIAVWDKGVGRPMKGRLRNHLEYVVWASHGPLTESTEDYPSALIRVPTVSPVDREHVTQKPVALLAELLRMVSAVSPVILDPFVGSGSTLVAAKESGLRSVGVEIDERYCEIAARRLAQGVLDFEGTA